MGAGSSAIRTVSSHSRSELAATVNRIATLDLPAGIVTVPWPDGVRTSDTPPTERVVAGVNVAEIGSRPGFPKDYACPFIRRIMPVLLCPLSTNGVRA